MTKMSSVWSWRSFFGWLILIPCICKTNACYLKPGFIQLDYPDEAENFVIGSDIYVKCGLLNNTFTTLDGHWHTTLDHSNLRFRVSGKSLDETSEFVEKIDDNTIAYVKRNVTVNDSLTLGCYGEGLDEHNKTTAFPGCYKSVNVGTRPQNVLNFECTSFSFSNMTCTWENPANKVRTQYTLESSFGSSRNFKITWSLCPESQTLPGSCSWSADTNPAFDKFAEKFFFRMNGTNDLGTESWEYTFKHGAIVKLSPVIKLPSKIISPREATIRWNPPMETTHGGWKKDLGIEYVVVISRANSNETRTILTNDTAFNLTKLLPNHEYNVSVRARTNLARRLDLDSDPVYTTLHMDKDIPDKPPALSPSAFKYKLFNTVRTVTILFSEIPSTNWNDDHFKYIVQVCSLADRTCYNRTEEHTSVELEDLSLSKQYNVNVWSVNSLGSSPTSSDLIIRPQSELLPAPTNLQDEIDNHAVTLRWTTPKSLKKLDSLYADVYWCKMDEKRSCKGEIHTKRVNNEDSYRIEENDPKSYIFGVALSHSDGRTSGSVWSVCQTSVGAEVGQVNELEVLSDTSTTLKLKWKTGCGYDRRNVSGYQVEYCRVEHHAEDVLLYAEECEHRRPREFSSSCHLSNFTVSSNEDNHTLTDLETGEVYRVVLRAMDSQGKFAPDSLAACARAQSTGYSVFNLILIAIGAASGFCIIILSVTAVVKRMGGEYHSTKKHTVSLPLKVAKVDKHNPPQTRGTEMQVIESNGVYPEIDVQMTSDFSSGSHSSLDRLIPGSNLDPVTTQKNSLESPNLKGEPQHVLSMELPTATDARAPPAAAVYPAVISQPMSNGISQYTATTMPPYTQLGLSATHFVAVPEQPRNTGYSQLSVVPSAPSTDLDDYVDDDSADRENDEYGDDDDEDGAPSPEPEALPRRPPNNPGYVAFDVKASASSNGYVPAVRARQ